MGKIDKLQFVDFTHTMRYVMKSKKITKRTYCIQQVNAL